MYKFYTVRAAGFMLSYSSPSVGDQHLKRFAAPGTTPHNQMTMNLYLAGEFEVSVGSFAQRLIAGQSSLDLALGEYPAGEVITEQPLVAGSRRLCIAPATPARWNRAVISLAPNDSLSIAEGELGIVLAGRVTLAGDPRAVGDFAVGPCEILAPVAARIVRAGA